MRTNIHSYQPTTTVSSRFTAHCSHLAAENHAFSSKERDTETGLSYFGARYYSSDLSIWLSVDPMSDKYPSLSPYVYCANNPVKLVDPNGEEVINGYAKELSASQELVAFLTARLNCLEKGTKQYGQTKRWLFQESRRLNHIQSKYDVVERAIKDFRKHCPENFDKLNNLSDDTGTNIDVVIFLKYNLNNNLNKGQSAIRRGSIFNSRTLNSTYFVQSAQVYLNPNACLNQDDIGRTLAHEGGHVFYEVTHTTEYATWLINGPHYYDDKYDGHGLGDMSGVTATDWENNY